MDDKQIINLFFQRDEDAINAVDEKYGSKLNALAANMLQSREDGLECASALSSSFKSAHSVSTFSRGIS